MREEKGLLWETWNKRTTPTKRNNLFNENLPQNATGWLDYYIYAQQLYNAGDRERAEAYYHKAQKLYYTEDARNSTEYISAGPTMVPNGGQGVSIQLPPITPPNKNKKSTVPEQAVSISKPPSIEPAPPYDLFAKPIDEKKIQGSSSLEEDWKEFAELNARQTTLSVRRPKKSGTKLIARSFVILFFLTTAGFGALYYVYKNQPNQEGSANLNSSTTNAGFLHTLIGPEQKRMMTKAIHYLEPTFMKVDRVSNSAKLLLADVGLLEIPKTKTNLETAPPQPAVPEDREPEWKVSSEFVIEDEQCIPGICDNNNDDTSEEEAGSEQPVERKQDNHLIAPGEAPSSPAAATKQLEKPRKPSPRYKNRRQMKSTAKGAKRPQRKTSKR